MNGKLILVVDDEAKMRRVLEIALRNEGYSVVSAENGREALALFESHAIDLVIADLRMPEMGGIELLASLRRQSSVPVLVVTAHGTIETAVEAMKHGAFDYILRPFDMDTLLLAIGRALSTARMAQQNAFLREEIDRGRGDFIGSSAPMQAVYALIRQAAPSRAPVLITGETGTGKELAARALHTASPRQGQLFVPINCAAIPAEIIEGELFGHEKGAFTGALRDRVGKFELADGGTLFLDEITEMPIALQSKLLRVLQDGTIQRVGSNRDIALDLRLVAATNRDPARAIAESRLREDLFYRLNVITLALPPLRERRSDIAVLAAHFVEKFTGRRAELPADVVARLEAHAWPGNVRELENLVERASILSGDGEIDLARFLPPAAANPAPAEGAAASAGVASLALEHEVRLLEERLIAQALRQSGDNKARAAALLGISERTLWYKLRRHAKGED